MAVGIIAHRSQFQALLLVEQLLAPVGQVWLSALQMTVLPLIITNLVTAILANAQSSIFGRAGVGSLLLFVTYLVAGGAFAIVAGGLVIGQIPVSDDATAGFSQLSGSASRLAPDGSQGLDLGSWLVSLVPTNPFQAMAEGHLLPVLLFVIAFAAAAARVSVDNRQTLYRFFAGASEAMMVLVHWVLKATPVGVLALALTVASGVGADAVTALVQYLVLICGHLLLFTALLYPASALIGGIPVSQFTRAVAPAQVVAVSTRSSLASLPALLDAARARLNLTPSVAEVSLPLGVAVFKCNRAISSVIKLLFIAHLFSIDLTTGQVLVFLVTIIIISFSAVGIPFGGGGMSSLPAYLAAGVPLEGYIMFRAVETIPDIFKTLLNVTADMSVAVLLARFLRGPVSLENERLAAETLKREPRLPP